MKIEFWGGSDDLIEVRIDGKNHAEIGGYISGEGRYSKALEVRSVVGTLGLRVHAIYDGCWSFSAGQIEEGLFIPQGWTLTVEQQHAYSTRLLVNTGDDSVHVTRENGKPLSSDEDD